MIAVFAYAFAHRKTQDFLLEIAAAGHREVTVIGAPFQKLKHAGDTTSYWGNSARRARAHDTPALCARLGFDFVELPHSDVEAIAKLAQDKGLRLGIISGARILKRGVIEAFAEGIVNFHPGKIPETSGLDAFFYTLKNNVDAGVTTHFVDPRVDAGDFLAFDAVQLGADDSAEMVQENGYQLQITALRRFLADWQAGRLAPSPIDRPFKNEPMTPAQKWQMVQHFPRWRAARYMAQQGAALHAACKGGETDAALAVLDTHPGLLEQATPEGWTPLILAVFGQHRALAEALLARGANPNATGLKGTTVLMYAKTALMGQAEPSLDLLDLLITHGADASRCDCYGKSVAAYVQDDPALLAYFTKHGA